MAKAFIVLALMFCSTPVLATKTKEIKFLKDWTLSVPKDAKVSPMFLGVKEGISIQYRNVNYFVVGNKGKSNLKLSRSSLKKELKNKPGKISFIGKNPDKKIGVYQTEDSQTFYFNKHRDHLVVSPSTNLINVAYRRN